MIKTNVFLQELWAMNHLNVAVQEKVALHLDECDREIKRLRAIETAAQAVDKAVADSHIHTDWFASLAGLHSALNPEVVS